jgi:trimethylamine:corrinoid methyltransferase-like protein
MSENTAVDQEATNARRGRAASGGAAARRAARSGGGPGTQLTYIKRKIKLYEVLDEEGLALIEKNTDTVLGRSASSFATTPRRCNCGKKPAPTSRASACISRRGSAARF